MTRTRLLALVAVILLGGVTVGAAVAGGDDDTDGLEVVSERILPPDPDGEPLDEGAPLPEEPGAAGDAPAEDGGDGPDDGASSPAGSVDPPAPAEWSLREARTSDEALRDGLATPAGDDAAAAYLGALRREVARTDEVPDELLLDYPVTICTVGREEPSRLVDILEALAGTPDIDTALAHYLTGAAVATHCPELSDMLAG